ncbi:ABC transporter permease subunit [Streptomyces sp. JV185]|uniref:ABC transporter permease subunit n=1 Tax=Streptomyces sp. JV185 TaxID=858638 RepID=UPI002E796343|nr:ABC transporter permease subunit [Streptomyces sp. JV185]MEE1767901.1 ABC transporter permease subunit [Streptomyces sp. JV185]
MSAIALRGPERVVLAQHRWALRVMVVLPVPAAAALVGTWLWTQHVVDAFAATGCSVMHTTPACTDTVSTYLDRQLWMQDVLNWSGLLMMVLPAFVGIFVAGPVIARELESGTYRLAWTQSVTPARWLVAKLAVPTAVTLVPVSVLSAVCSWARAQENPVHEASDWYTREVYGSIGTVPVGYALCMLALGALVGLLLRRTVAAMVVTVLAYVPLVMVLNRVREDLWPTLRATAGDWQGSHIWFVDTGMLTASGKAIYWKDCSGVAGDNTTCMRDRGGVTSFADYHPASHFWPLQLVETGILLVLAALAVALAFRVLRRRHG